MSAMRAEVFGALRAIDIPEDKALRAATAMSRRDEDVATIKAELVLIKWMIGSLFALFAAVNVPLVWIVLRMAGKVGALA